MSTQPITLLLHVGETVAKSGAVLFSEAISPLVLCLLHGFDLFADAIAVARHRLQPALAGSVSLEIARPILDALSTPIAGAYLWMARYVGLRSGLPAGAADWVRPPLRAPPRWPAAESAAVAKSAAPINAMSRARIVSSCRTQSLTDQ